MRQRHRVIRSGCYARRMRFTAMWWLRESPGEFVSVHSLGRSKTAAGWLREPGAQARGSAPIRVTVLGALAMALNASVGALFGNCSDGS